jgi:molecular chaperone GrpE
MAFAKVVDFCILHHMNNDEDTKATTHEDDFEDVTFVDSTEDGEALPTKDVTKKLREELKTVRKEKEEYLTGWQRAKADYVNLQKEEERKRKELRNFITLGLVEDLLPALDSFDMAFANKEAWEKVDANWRSGVEYIQKQFLQALESYGVSKIDQANVSFDPMLHESIETVSTDDQSEDHTIASITQSGYKMGDKVIRPARVKVYEFR